MSFCQAGRIASNLIIHNKMGNIKGEYFLTVLQDNVAHHLDINFKLG
jgi:hypothetical protein